MLAGGAGESTLGRQTRLETVPRQEERPEGEKRNAVGESLPWLGWLFEEVGGTPPTEGKRMDGRTLGYSQTWKPPSALQL